MKKQRISKFFAMLIALSLVVMTGCSSSSGGDENEAEATYKVELGDVSWDEYEAYDNWRYPTGGNGPVISYSVLKDKRDELYSQTNAGTYEDKGTLSASELKTFLVQNGDPAVVAEDSISFADACGNEITFLFLDSTYQTATWVYIEK